MASNFYSPEHRHDPAHWTRTNVGLTSPLWWPFLMAASAGAAWWTYTNWGRIASTSWTGDLQRLAGSNGDGAPGLQPAPVAAALDQSLAVQGADSHDTDDDTGVDDLGVDDGSDAIDAAYAANLGPVPAPKKRSATKSAGGSAAKRPAAKAAKKAPAKGTTAKKTAAKNAPAKGVGKKR